MKKQTMVIILLVVVAVMLLAVLIVGCILLIGPHECSFGEWEIIKQATCAEEGQRQRTCSCGEKQVESIEALEHSYAVLDDALEPTCVESGLTSTTHCSACGIVLVGQQIVPALGHNFSEDWTVDVEATFTSVGSRSHHCTRCGEKGSVTEIPMLPYSDGLEYVLNFGGTSYSVKSIGTFEGTDLNITPVYNGLQVTGISALAFKECNRLTSITIPNSVMTIGDNAFAYCTNLTSITLPNSTNSIGYGIFYGCNRLQSISMSWAGLEYDYLYTLFGGNSFDYKIPNSLSTVIITGGTAIGTNAFKDCTTLRKVYIPSSITYIGTNAFRGCNNLTIFSSRSSKPSGWASGWNWDNCPVEWDYDMDLEGNIEYTLNADGRSYSVTGIGTFSGTVLVIPEIHNSLPVTAIAEEAFAYCRKLTYLSLPHGLQAIGRAAFYSCGILTSVTIPSSVTSIGNSAFQYCGIECITISHLEQRLYDIFGMTSIDELKTIIIPDGVTTIGGQAFSGCEGLENIIIPESVTTIGERAFWGCWSLKNITIPNSVTTIGDMAFSNCGSLETIIIPDSVTTIGEGAFSGCISLTSITIPDSVTVIGDYTFGDCESLENVIIPDSVTTIGVSTFAGCSSLTNIIIPDSVTSIGWHTFDDCTNLTSVTIPFAFVNDEWGYILTELGELFDERRSNTDPYDIPESLKTIIITGGTTIGDYAFSDFSSLTSIIIPDSVTSIGDYAFYGCESLKSITIPSSVTSIGDDAFWGCSSLETITMPAVEWGPNLPESVKTVIIDGGTSIDYGTIDGYNLEKIIISDGITTIGDHAFSICENLTSITIPDSVTTIGEFAFSGCESLKSITIPNSVTTIGDQPFDDCSSLETITMPAVESHIYFPESVKTVVINGGTTIGGDMFWDSSSLEKIIISASVSCIHPWAFESNENLVSVVFEDSDGWYRTKREGAKNGTKLNLSNPEKNAKYLTDTYSEYYWYKK